MRSVWKTDLPPAVREVTKNVRGLYEALDESEGREGIDIAGAKALHILDRMAVRLKSCPDASCSLGFYETDDGAPRNV